MFESFSVINFSSCENSMLVSAKIHKDNHRKLAFSLAAQSTNFHACNFHGYGRCDASRAIVVQTHNRIPQTPVAVQHTVDQMKEGCCRRAGGAAAVSGKYGASLLQS